MTRATAPTTLRSDASIFAEARRALDLQSNIPATVRVHVDKATATLTGTVRLASESAEAESIVRRVSGVGRVVNEINVAQAPNRDGLDPPDRRE